MPRYDAVLIDLDETLFDFRRAGHEALEASFQAAGLILSDEWYRLYYATNAELWREVEEGRTSVTALRVERFRRYFSRLGLAIEPAAFSAGYEQRILSVTYHIEGAVEAVREIAGMAQVVVLTNGISHVQRARINRSPIAHLIRAVIVSEEAGVSKPDPGIFSLAAGFTDCSDRSRMLMIGDSLASDIAGGIAFGIDTCWYNPTAGSVADHVRPGYEVRHLSDLPAIVRG